MNANIQTVRELTHAIRNDPTLAQTLKNDPQAFLEGLAAATPAYVGDIWIYRGVVLILGVVVCATVMSGIIISVKGLQELPAALIGLGSTALGALAGLLAPSPIRNRGA
jgi:hypothetical protein